MDISGGFNTGGGGLTPEDQEKLDSLTVLTPEELEKIDSIGKLYIKSAAPSVNDDETQGYEQFDKWFDDRNAALGGMEMYMLLDPTAGSAKWDKKTLDTADLQVLFDAKVGHNLVETDDDFLIGQEDPADPGAFYWIRSSINNIKTKLELFLTQTAAAIGFTLSGGTSSKTLTVSENTTLSGGTHSGNNSGDNPGVTSVSTSSPLTSTGGDNPTISLINNAEPPETITLIDIGTLVDSDRIIPTSKVVKDGLSNKATLGDSVYFESVQIGDNIELENIEYVIAESSDGDSTVVSKITIEFDDLGTGTQNGVMKFWIMRAGVLTNVLELDGS